MNKVSQLLDLRGGGIRGGAWLTGGGRNGGGGMFGGSGPGGKKGGGILAGSASELVCSEITYKSSRHMIQFPDVSSMSVLHWRLRRAWEHVMCVTWMLFPSRLWRRRPSTLLMVAVCLPITSMVPGVFLQQIQTYTNSLRDCTCITMFSTLSSRCITDSQLIVGLGDMTVYHRRYICASKLLCHLLNRVMKKHVWTQKYSAGRVTTSPNVEKHVIKGVTWVYWLQLPCNQCYFNIIYNLW